MEFDKVQDSGSRQEFNTGSVRDSSIGKGQPHLVPGVILNQILNEYFKQVWDISVPAYKILLQLNRTVNLLSENLEFRTDSYNQLIEAGSYAVRYLVVLEKEKFSEAMRRLYQHYENGGRKYSKNNWRKGQPVSRYYDSTKRHIDKAIEGKEDEDHPAAILWNIIGMLQTKIDVSHGFLPIELDDFPFTLSEIFPNKDK